MSMQRFNQLYNWADPDKWSSWALVMYYNGISVQESWEFVKIAREFFDDENVCDFVVEGIDSFF